MEFYVLGAMSFLLGVYFAKDIRNKKQIKDYVGVVKEQSKIITTYKELIMVYETKFQKLNELGEIPKDDLVSNKFDIDDILVEISKKGIENISREKISFLKKYRK